MRGFTPAQDGAVEPGLARIAVETVAKDVVRIAMHEAGVDELTRDEPNAAGRLKMIDVGLTVRIDASQRRGDAGEIGEVLPVDAQPGSGGASTASFRASVAAAWARCASSGDIAMLLMCGPDA